jgi:hypothetical protein
MNLFEFFSVPSIDEHEDKKKGANPKDDTERQQLSDELFWYILDHDDIHKKHFLPIAKKIHDEYKKTKKIDRSKYQECWMPMVREACLEFHEKNKMFGHPNKVFDGELCKHLCKRLAERHIEDIKKGEYKLG